jgi:hypothetical protein
MQLNASSVPIRTHSLGRGIPNFTSCSPDSLVGHWTWQPMAGWLAGWLAGLKASGSHSKVESALSTASGRSPPPHFHKLGTLSATCCTIKFKGNLTSQSYVTSDHHLARFCVPCLQISSGVFHGFMFGKGVLWRGSASVGSSNPWIPPSACPERPSTSISTPDVCGEERG